MSEAFRDLAMILAYSVTETTSKSPDLRLMALLIAVSEGSRLFTSVPMVGDKIATQRLFERLVALDIVAVVEKKMADKPAYQLRWPKDIEGMKEGGGEVGPIYDYLYPSDVAGTGSE